MVKLAGRIIVHDWNISQSVVTGYLGISKDRVICLRNWRLDAYFDIFMVELQSTWINADKGFEFWQWSDLIFSLAYRVDETFVPKPSSSRSRVGARLRKITCQVLRSPSSKVSGWWRGGRKNLRRHLPFFFRPTITQLPAASRKSQSANRMSQWGWFTWRQTTVKFKRMIRPSETPRYPDWDMFQSCTIWFSQLIFTVDHGTRWGLSVTRRKIFLRDR